MQVIWTRGHRGGRSRSKLLQLLIKMEAAGIEPASESSSPVGTTCVSRGLSSSGGSNTGTLPAGPSPNESRFPPSGRHGKPAHFFDGTCRRHGLGSGVPRARPVFKRPARAQRCRWRLCRCPFFEEARSHPLHAPKGSLPSSKPVRPHGGTRHLNITAGRPASSNRVGSARTLARGNLPPPPANLRSGGACSWFWI